MDGITALLKGRNKELVKMAETVLRKLKKEVEEKGLTGNGKEGKSKKITSCKFLEGKLRDCSQIERMIRAGSVETLGVDLRTDIKQLGAKREGEKKEVQCEIRVHQPKWDLSDELNEDKE